MTRWLSSILLSSVVFVGCSGPAKPAPAHTADVPPPDRAGTDNGANPGTSPGASAECPAIQLKAPDSVSAGTRAHITASLVGAPSGTAYNWSVSAGTIVSGQGTPEIVVETKGLGGSSVTATLELGGLSTQCGTTTANASMLVGPAS